MMKWPGRGGAFLGGYRSVVPACEHQQIFQAAGFLFCHNCHLAFLLHPLQAVTGFPHYVLQGVHKWLSGGGLQPGGQAQDPLLVLQHSRPHGVCPQGKLKPERGT